MTTETAGPTLVCRLDEIEADTAKRIDLGGHRLALVRLGDDVFVIGDRCSHADYSLAEGELDADDETLECWKHGSTFSVRDGAPTCLPATKPVPTYDVSVVDGEIWVVLP